MNNDTIPKYRLVRIIDKQSDYKSRMARMICKEVFSLLDIEYIESLSRTFTNCKNNLNCKKGIICPKEILDIFTLRHIDTGEKMNVGNHCIQSLIMEGFVKIPDGYSRDKMIRLIKKLKNPSIPCIICEENHVSKEWSFHKKCLTDKNNHVVQNKKDCLNELIARDVLSRLRKILKNNGKIKTIIRRIQNREILSDKDMNEIHNIKEKYILLYQHTDKLLRLNHNPIIQTMKQMKRFPTDKQMRIIEKILNNYNRMKQINDMYSHKYRPIYDRYGFVY